MSVAGEGANRATTYGLLRDHSNLSHRTRNWVTLPKLLAVAAEQAPPWTQDNPNAVTCNSIGYLTDTPFLRLKTGMKAYVSSEERFLNKTVAQLQENCPFPIDGSTQLSITRVVNPRADSYGIVCLVSAATGAKHEVVVRVSLTYYLAAKALLEFIHSATGLEAKLPLLH